MPRSSGTVTGSLSDRIARNGIVVRTGASAQVWSNTVTGNFYGPSVDATGILVIEATVNMTKQNTVSDNQIPILNEDGTVVGKKGAE